MSEDTALHSGREAAPSCGARDLAGSAFTYGLVWGVPITALVGGLFLDQLSRTIIWTVSLSWMGLACILNARRCGRTHCRFTGPFYLVMTIPVLALGSADSTVSIYGWIALGAFILVASKAVWWATDRSCGKYS